MTGEQYILFDCFWKFSCVNLSTITSGRCYIISYQAKTVIILSVKTVTSVYLQFLCNIILKMFSPHVAAYFCDHAEKRSMSMHAGYRPKEQSRYLALIINVGEKLLQFCFKHIPDLSFSLLDGNLSFHLVYALFRVYVIEDDI